MYEWKNLKIYHKTKTTRQQQLKHQQISQNQTPLNVFFPKLNIKQPDQTLFINNFKNIAKPINPFKIKTFMLSDL